MPTPDCVIKVQWRTAEDGTRELWWRIGKGPWSRLHTPIKGVNGGK